MKKFLLAGCVIAALVFTGCPQEGDDSPSTPKVAAPVADTPAGQVPVNKVVKLSTTTEEAAIYYTVDGTAPTRESTAYPAAGITIDAAKTIKAFAVKEGLADSDLLEAAYTVAADAPVPDNSPVAEGETIKLTVPEEGTIYYTLDGNPPVVNADGTPGAGTLTYDRAKGIELTFGAGDSLTITTVTVTGTGDSLKIGAPVAVTYTKAEYTYTVAAEEENGTTKYIVFTFNEAVSGLTASDIKVENGTGKVTSSGKIAADAENAKVWKLELASVEAVGDVTVTITRTGIDALPHTVAVNRNQYSTVTEYTALADGEADIKTTGKITLTFTGADAAAATEGLLAGDITVTGAVNGALTKVPPGEDDPPTGDVVYELALTVTTAGEQTVTVNKPGSGISSAPVTVTLSKDVTPTAKVTGLKWESTLTTVTLTWANPLDADFDHVEITWTGKSDPVTPPAPEEGKATTYKAENLTRGTPYTFTVAAVDKDGNKNEATVEAETKSEAKPGAPEYTPPADETITFTYTKGSTPVTGNALNTLSLSTKDKDTLTVTAVVTGTVTYRWALDGVEIDGATANAVTLTAGIEKIPAGKHTVTVFVTKGGKEYSKETVAFTVAK